MFDIVNLWKTKSLYQRDILFFFFKLEKIINLKMFCMKMNVKFSLTSVLGIPKTDEMAAIFLQLIKVFKLKKNNIKLKCLLVYIN